MKTFQIIPDRLIDNTNAEKLADSLYELYAPPLKRIDIANRRLRPKSQIFWEIEMTHSSARYYVTTPDDWAEYIVNQIQTCWPKATVTAVRHTYDFQTETIAGGTLSLGQHFFLSLSTDRRTLAPLPAIMEVTRRMQRGDVAIIQVGMDPAPPDWYTNAQEAMDRFRRGEMPRRLEITPERALTAVVKTGAAVGMGLMSTVAEFILEKEIETPKLDDADRAGRLRQGPLSTATITKPRGNAFDVTMRLLVTSPDETRRQILLRDLITAYKTLDGDNEFKFKPAKEVSKLADDILMRRLSKIKVNPDYLSTAEIAKLISMPPASLQDEFPIECIAHRESGVPTTMNKGIPLGDVTKQGITTRAHWPVTNHDELCLPRVCIGGLGTGKSLGYGAGFATDAIRAGYTIFAIDTTDGDLSDTVRDSLPVNFPSDHIVDLNFGDTEHPIALNWGEAARRSCRNREVANILANQLVFYLAKFSDDAGDRTERYLRAAARTVFLSDPEATILEVILFLCSSAFRASMLPDIKDPRLQELWRDFDSMSDALRGQIISPILNRLDALTGNEFVANCVLQKGRSLDFRRLADGDNGLPYCVLLRVPKSVLWETATDALATYLIAKVWLAILTRIDQPIHERKPTFLIMDEPHQFLGSARGGIKSTWGSMIAESRKWRLGLVWMFHDWAQIPKELASLIKAAGPHYTIYSSSKATFQDLAEEIAPYTVEECLKIPTHTALNVIKCGDRYHRILAKMLPPPIDVRRGASWRHEFVGRSHRTEECTRQFGRHIDEVEEDVFRREQILYNKK